MPDIFYRVSIFNFLRMDPRQLLAGMTENTRPARHRLSDIYLEILSDSARQAIKDNRYIFSLPMNSSQRPERICLLI
jgi:hypothetical protein